MRVFKLSIPKVQRCSIITFLSFILMGERQHSLSTRDDYIVAHGFINAVDYTKKLLTNDQTRYLSNEVTEKNSSFPNNLADDERRYFPPTNPSNPLMKTELPLVYSIPASSSSSSCLNQSSSSNDQHDASTTVIRYGVCYDRSYSQQWLTNKRLRPNSVTFEKSTKEISSQTRFSQNEESSSNLTTEGNPEGIIPEEKSTKKQIHDPTQKDTLLDKMRSFDGFLSKQERREFQNINEVVFGDIVCVLKSGIGDFSELCGMVHQFIERKQIVIDLINSENRLLSGLLHETFIKLKIFFELKITSESGSNFQIIQLFWELTILISRIGLELSDMKFFSYKSVLYHLTYVFKNFFDINLINTISVKAYHEKIFQGAISLKNTKLSGFYIHSDESEKLEYYSNLHLNNTSTFLIKSICYFEEISEILNFKSNTKLFKSPKYLINKNFRIKKKVINKKLHIIKKVKEIDQNLHQSLETILA